MRLADVFLAEGLKAAQRQLPREVVRVVTERVAQALGAVVCRVRGHREEVEEFVHGEWDEDRQRWVEIDGAGVTWHCTRCGRGGKAWW